MRVYRGAVRTILCMTIAALLATVIYSAVGLLAGRNILVHYGPPVSSREEDQPVNINSADLKQLIGIPHIGEKRARDIIAHRESHGPFEAIEDIMEVEGIGEGIFQSIKEYICI